MERGKRYWHTPMARRRGRLRALLALILLLGLMAGVTGLCAYWIGSSRDKALQQELSAAHSAGLATASAAENGSLTAPLPLPTAQAQAAPTESPAAARAAFFQVIGLTREAFKPILRRNADAVGWIAIEGLVDQPIVYRDNRYYLTHGFDGRVSAGGAIFLDENHPLRADTQNLLLYGHNMKDETMFGTLGKYMKDNFLRAHYQATLETRIETFGYLIFAVDRVSMDTASPDFLYFWGYPSFADDEAFARYIDEVYAHSLYTRFLDVAPTDALLTLVTCEGDDRLVLLARRQRATDTPSALQHALLGLYMR